MPRYQRGKRVKSLWMVKYCDVCLSSYTGQWFSFPEDSLYHGKGPYQHHLRVRWHLCLTLDGFYPCSARSVIHDIHARQRGGEPVDFFASSRSACNSSTARCSSFSRAAVRGSGIGVGESGTKSIGCSARNAAEESRGFPALGTADVVEGVAAAMLASIRSSCKTCVMRFHCFGATPQALSNPPSHPTLLPLHHPPLHHQPLTTHLHPVCVRWCDRHASVGGRPRRRAEIACTPAKCTVDWAPAGERGLGCSQ